MPRLSQLPARVPNHCLLVAAFLTLVCAVLTTAARAEKEPLSPEELTRLATHIVVGRVNAIYTYETKDENWHTTHCLAEVKIDKLEKGAGLQPDGMVYARYWQRGWISPKRQPPGTNGHSGAPAVGDQVRVYLVNKGYDGGGETNDGGFNVVFGNGCEVLKSGKRAAAAGNTPAVGAAKK